MEPGPFFLYLFFFLPFSQVQRLPNANRFPYGRILSPPEGRSIPKTVRFRTFLHSPLSGCAILEKLRVAGLFKLIALTILCGRHVAEQFFCSLPFPTQGLAYLAAPASGTDYYYPIFRLGDGCFLRNLFPDIFVRQELPWFSVFPGRDPGTHLCCFVGSPIGTSTLPTFFRFR